MPRASSPTLPIGILLATVLLASCGGGGSNSDGGAAPAPAAPAPASPDANLERQQRLAMTALFEGRYTNSACPQELNGQFQSAASSIDIVDGQARDSASGRTLDLLSSPIDHLYVMRKPAAAGESPMIMATAENRVAPNSASVGVTYRQSITDAPATATFTQTDAATPRFYSVCASTSTVPAAFKTALFPTLLAQLSSSTLAVSCIKLGTLVSIPAQFTLSGGEIRFNDAVVARPGSDGAGEQLSFDGGSGANWTSSYMWGDDVLGPYLIFKQENGRLASIAYITGVGADTVSGYDCRPTN